MDPAGRPARSSSPEARVRASLLRILRSSQLCAVATSGPGGRAHIHTAYFSFSDSLELFFLSHPKSLHVRNLVRDPRAAVAVFSQRQRWGGPDRGVQLFGRCISLGGRAREAAERCYGRRFPAYADRENRAPPGSPIGRYELYGIRISRLKLLDEREFGDGVFVRAKVTRPAEPRSG